MNYTGDWMRQGECAGAAANKTNSVRVDKTFFPQRGRPSNNPPHREYCTPCPVRMECLKYAVVHELDGVWGNTTRSQRDLLPQVWVMQLVQEAIVEGWYEPYLPPEDQVLDGNLDLTLQMMQLDGEQYLDAPVEALTAEDFDFEFEWVEYQQKMIQIVESFDTLLGE